MNLEQRLEQIKELNYEAYEVKSIELLEDLNSVGIVLKHKKSGARIAVISNDDDNKVFSIGFKTPPTNDTGMQHIIEHSTLCGSRKYPVKDPFVELCKSSLNTFLNAMTYPDKTVYPVASCNMSDFKNIMDVYMDAVFYPDIYKHEEIFRQEGWHYELDSVDSELRYNGVVFNEMKGAFSSADDVLSRYTFVGLFPDSVYRYESGGDPEVIPDLKYEDFLAYHKEYYHPANSYIYLYGDVDVQERLDYLDREYLSDFDKNDVAIDSFIPLQKPFDKPVTDVREYAVTEDESLEDNTYLSYNVVCSTSLDAKNYLAMQILDYALVLAPGAPLKQALIDAGIGTDIYSNFETSLLQPVYSIIAKNANQDKNEEFVSIIENTLKKLADEGISRRMLEAGINYYEFKYREADYGPYPKGLMYYLTMMDSWLYDSSKPFIHVEAGETFALIKEEMKNGLFEDTIRKNILENNHELVLSLIPKYGLEREQENKERQRLQNIKSSLSVEELEKIVSDTKHLKEYQDEPSSQEDLQSIPMLGIEDIDKEPQKLYIDHKTVSGTGVIHSNLFTNGIAYIMLAFDCKNVPDELLPYLGILSSTLGLMDTDSYDYAELSNEININCGGISTDSAVYSDTVDKDKCSILYEVKGKALYEKIPFVLKMMNEIIYHTKFHEYKRLKEIIARIRSRMESTMMSSGHSVAMLNCMAQYSRTAYYSNTTRGYYFYQLIQKLDDEFEEKKEDIADKLDLLVRYIFNKSNLIVSYTADDAGFVKFSEAFEKFAKELPDIVLDVADRVFAPLNIKKGYTSSAQVQYVSRCGNFAKEGYKYTGALKVLKVIFSYDYLWINVRVKGGAYGCMSGFYRNGDVYMVSYRDPNLRETNSIFEEAAEYVKNFNVSERDMVKFIIGTIGEVDAPLNPSAKGVRSFGAYISNTDYEFLRKEREEILNADVNSIRALAPYIECAMKQNYLCVVGNQDKIQDEEDLFDEIKPLIIYGCAKQEEF
ncbi:MAG: insulinase family protein [Lachnospira sp.]